MLTYFSFCSYWMHFDFCFSFFTRYSHRNYKFCNRIKTCAITAGVKKYKQTIKKIKNENDKIVIFQKTKLNSIKILISKALIDSNISHGEFVLRNKRN